MTWTLHYDDRSTYSSEDSPPHTSPPWGAVFVTQPGLSGHDLIWGSAYLYFREDERQWFGADLPGLVDQLAHYAHRISAVRPGREMVSSKIKARIAEAAREMRGR